MRHERFASATIKFLDFDICSGRTEFMVGSKYVTLNWEQSQMFRRLESWDSGLERVSSHLSPSVWKFSAKNAHRAEGVTKAGIIADLMGISGRLV